jgi:hypothetical protein
MNIELIKQTSRAKYLHSLAKLSNKENHESQLLVTLNGGTFRSSPEIISFLSLSEMGDTVVLLDIYENPIKVNRLDLLEQCIQSYKNTMASWHAVSEQINQQR